MSEIADVEHAHEMVPIELGEIAPLPIAFAKIAEGAFRSEGGAQFLIHGALVDRLIEAPVENRKKVAHRGFCDLTGFLLRVVDVDMAAENKFLRCRFPAFFSRFAPIVVEGIFDL